MRISPNKEKLPKRSLDVLILQCWRTVSKNMNFQ
jgi:hypothetical protein